MGHGSLGLVLDDSTLIRVSVRVLAGERRTSFDASRLRLLRDGTTSGKATLGGSVGGGKSRPNASVEGAVSFVVPRDGAQLRLGAAGTSTRLCLLKIDEAPAGAAHLDMSGMSTRGPPTPHHHSERK